MMRKLILFSVAIIALNLNAQIEVKSDGRVAVGNTGTEPTDLDFTVMNTYGSTSAFAYTSLRMDDVNNYVRLNRNGTHYRNEVTWYNEGTNKWSMGLNDLDNASGSSNSLFIGENIGGSSPFMWFDGTNNCIGMFTQNPNTSYKLTVNGNAIINGTWTSSDIGLKQNINSIESALEKILAIRGVTFEYNSEFDNLYGFDDTVDPAKVYTDSTGNVLDQFEQNNANPFSETKYGVIAQEIKEQFPELAHKGSDGYYAVNYTGLIPVLIEAIKEQQTSIEEFQSEIDDLKNLLVQNDYKKSLTTEVNDIVKPTESILYQNAPNPFSNITEIKYNIPEGKSDTYIIICDMTGKQLKRVQLLNAGESSISISSNELEPGIFMYSMVEDGIIIDTKQMIITDN